MAVSVLPSINSALNAASAVLLSLGYIFLKRGRVGAHKACMLSAFATSTLFLVLYLVYHFQVGSVRFPGRGWSRPFYFSILLSHTLLAVLIVPLALRVLYLAWRGRFDKHMRIARIALPVWLYVSMTGVVVYSMLYLVRW